MKTKAPDSSRVITQRDKKYQLYEMIFEVGVLNNSTFFDEHDVTLDLGHIVR